MIAESIFGVIYTAFILMFTESTVCSGFNPRQHLEKLTILGLIVPLLLKGLVYMTPSLFRHSFIVNMTKLIIAYQIFILLWIYWKMIPLFFEYECFEKEFLFTILNLTSVALFFPVFLVDLIVCIFIS